MAYYLQFDGVDDEVTLASPVTLAVGQTLEFNGVYRQNANSLQMFIDVYGAAGDYVAFNSSGNLAVRINQIGETSSAALTEGQAFVVTIERTSTEYVTRLDGAVALTHSSAVQMDPLQGFGGAGALGHQSKCDLYSARVFDGTGDIHKWDPNATNGTGSVLPDTAGATDATLVNFVADPWVENVAPASLTVTPADLPLTPGGTISGTYADYTTVPTTLTVSDGTNTITIPTPTITDNGDGTGSFSGTMPALPTTGTASLVLFGDVTVELA